VIGIDTNILIRYFTQDDAAQAQRVDELFVSASAAFERLHIADVVLAELVWVLRRIYRIPKAEVVVHLQEVLESEIFEIDDAPVVHAAFADYRDGRGDFADYLIGRRNAAAGDEHTVTFDKALAPHPAFVVL
jgi:predicted nucleic-acid-binding protein